MKNFCISLISLAIIILIVIGLAVPERQTHNEYLRIHIRANSNEDVDQEVKYKVKDAVVEYLVPFVSSSKTKAQAEEIINGILSEISLVADGVLKANGFNYGARAKINNEKFPTRVYDGLTLSEGYYDALIVELGEGVGDNWWCVVYPPLCFTGSGIKPEYKSKIYLIIKNFYKDKEKI